MPVFNNEDMHASQTFISVREFAEARRIKPHKVLAWIKAGELAAVNVAANANGKRPRWRIPADAARAFDLRRSNKPQEDQPTKPRRRSGAGRRYV